MNKILQTAVGAGLVAAGAISGHMLTPTTEVVKNTPLSEEYIAFLPDDMAGVLDVNDFKGAKDVNFKPAIGAVTFKADETAVQAMREKGYVVEHDIIMNPLGGACPPQKECDCAPTPTPSPDVTDPIYYWQKRVGALAARAKIPSIEKAFVCVLDTGVDMSHRDLKGQILGCENLARKNSKDCNDKHGHGTHVAGTVGAIQNGVDTIGIANVKIFNMKVLSDDGPGYTSDIVQGVRKCADMGVALKKTPIISMSLGSARSRGPLKIWVDAIAYAKSKGAILVAAAGNDSTEVGYPAAYADVFAIAASDNSDKISSFSNRGPEIDFIAPGYRVVSLKTGGGVITKSGTSMATPIASAIFAIGVESGLGVKTEKIKSLKITEQGGGMLRADLTAGD